MKTLVLALLLFSFGLPVVLAIGSVIVNLRSDRERLGRYQAKLGAGFWGRVCLGAVHAMASTGLIGLTYWLGFFPGRQGRGGGPPLLLVHGLYHNPSVWIFFRRCLKRAGFGNIYTFGYNSFTRTYPDLVFEMTRRMEEVLAENPGQKVGLIGHSLGGLIVRGAMADDRFKGRLGAVITLGAPHQGSELAAFGIGRLARSLHPANPIFAQLRAQKPVEGVAKLSLFVPVDSIVFPVRCLEIEEPGWQQEARQPSVSHVGLAYDRGLAYRVIDQLRECKESGWFEAKA